MPTGIITSTRNWLAKATGLAGATMALLACEEPKEIGLSPTTPVGVFFSDTFSVQRSTVLLDSVQSNGLSDLLVGRYTDAIFGKARATSFARLSLSPRGGFIVQDKDNKVVTASQIVYDSTKLFTGYVRGYYYGDTLVRQEWSIHRLTEDIGTNNYDIRSTIAYEPQPLARFTINPRPFTNVTDTTSLIARLPDAIGQDLIKLANTDEGRDLAKFRALNKKGFAIVSNTTDRAALLQASTDSYVAVYYHVQGDTTARAYPFYLADSRFTNLTVDRTGTPLVNLRSGQALPASATNGRTYVQTFTGVTTKLEFPSLLSLEQNRRVAINRADLVITPTQPDGIMPGGGLPPYISLAELNGFQLARTSPNRIAQIVPNFPGIAVSRLETGFVSPQVVEYNVRSRDYTVNMTGYIQSILAGKTPNNGLVLLTPSSANIAPVNPSTNTLLPAQQQLYLNNRVQRMLLDGKASAKLVLFFTSSN